MTALGLAPMPLPPGDASTDEDPPGTMQSLIPLEPILSLPRAEHCSVSRDRQPALSTKETPCTLEQASILHNPCRHPPHPVWQPQPGSISPFPCPTKHPPYTRLTGWQAEACNFRRAMAQSQMCLECVRLGGSDLLRIRPTLQPYKTGREHRHGLGRQTSCRTQGTPP